MAGRRPLGLADLAGLDPAIRRQAAHALAEAPGHEAALCARLAMDPDPSVREALMLALLQLDTAEAADGLAALLGDDEPALRNGALETLKAMPAQAARLLDRLVAAADPDVRIFAVLLAAALPLPSVPGWLVRRLEADLDPNVCAAAAEVLAELGATAGVPALLTMRERFAEQPFLVFTATAALHRLGHA